MISESDKEILNELNKELSKEVEEVKPEPVEESAEEEQELEEEESEQEEEQQEKIEEEEESSDDGEPAPAKVIEEPEEPIAKAEGETDYKKLYESVMAPFKAVGKMMEVRTPEEAQKLMKMGADYTRKMQEISGHRKTIMLMEQNGIDEEKLKFLIDVQNKNPEAIQKLLKDSKIDPLDIDVDGEVNYHTKVKSITDVEVEAKSILEELSSTDEGKATIQIIRNTWDPESIHFAFNNPQVFNTIHEHIESGAYQQIMTELERQTTLGNVPANGSILEKYNVIGNQLFGTGEPSNATDRKPIKTRVATHSSVDGQKAKAASAPKGSKRQSLVLEDLMGLKDDDFLKAMKQKL